MNKSLRSLLFFILGHFINLGIMCFPHTSKPFCRLSPGVFLRENVLQGKHKKWISEILTCSRIIFCWNRWIFSLIKFRILVIILYHWPTGDLAIPVLIYINLWLWLSYIWAKCVVAPPGMPIFLNYKDFLFSILPLKNKKISFFSLICSLKKILLLHVNIALDMHISMYSVGLGSLPSLLSRFPIFASVHVCCPSQLCSLWMLAPLVNYS